VSDPTKPAYWSNVPVAVKLQIALATVTDITGPAGPKTLVPMRLLYKDTDQLCERFVTDVPQLEEALGGRDAVMSRHRAKMVGRTDAVQRTNRWLEYVQAAAEELAGRDLPEEAALVEIGHQLKDATRHLHGALTYREILQICPSVIRTLHENFALLDGNGFSKARIDEGVALFAECRGDTDGARRDLGQQQVLTIEAQALLDRVVAFFMKWAKRRKATQATVDYTLPGWDLSEAEHWAATRPSEIAARAQEARAEAARTAAATQASTPSAPGPSTPAPAPTGIVGEALEAFRAGTPTTSGPT
jgi:hypothetical protein